MRAIVVPPEEHHEPLVSGSDLSGLEIIELASIIKEEAMMLRHGASKRSF
ncbi:MAG: hypothetical protein JOZ58_03110, partial [Acetobacteraceae bacterium]|nr:hypothetical protein [Acetobacteraceae bacterium]